MRHVVIRSAAEFDALERDWSDLLARSMAQDLPLTHFWIVNWWRNFGAGHEPAIHCFYNEGKLVAACAMLMDTIRYRGIGLRRMSSMANGHSPYADLLLDKHVSESQLDGIVASILTSGSAQLTSFVRTPDDSLLSKRLRARPSFAGRPVGLGARFSTPLIRVDSDWDTFFGGRSQKFRKSMRNKVNRFAKTDGCRVERVPITASSDAVIEEMVTVSRNSWKGKIGTDLGTARGARAFLAGLIDWLGPAGGVHVWMARSGEHPIAYEFHVAYNGITYPLRADFDETFRELAPGSVVEFTALRDIFEGKLATVYDSCANSYWYLSNWTSEFRVHVDLEVFGTGVKPRLAHALEYRIAPLLRRWRDAWRKPKEATSSPPASH